MAASTDGSGYGGPGLEDASMSTPEELRAEVEVLRRAPAAEAKGPCTEHPDLREPASSGSRERTSPLSARPLEPRMEVLREENKHLRLRVCELELSAATPAAPSQGPKQKAAAPAAASMKDLGEPTEEDRQRVMEHLRSQAYVHLAPSRVAGVGVFALRPIPAGVDPFPVCNEHLAAKEQFSVCSAGDLRGVPESVMEQVRSFFAPLTEEDGWTPQRSDDGEVLYGVLATGMNSLNLSWYLNHSDDPNIAFQDAEEEGSYNSFVTRRRIEVGEELLTDYRELGQEFFRLVSGGVDR